MGRGAAVARVAGRSGGRRGAGAHRGPDVRGPAGPAAGGGGRPDDGAADARRLCRGAADREQRRESAAISASRVAGSSPISHVPWPSTGTDVPSAKDVSRVMAAKCTTPPFVPAHSTGHGVPHADPPDPDRRPAPAGAGGGRAPIDRPHRARPRLYFRDRRRRDDPAVDERRPFRGVCPGLFAGRLQGSDGLVSLPGPELVADGLPAGPAPRSMPRCRPS